MKTVSSYVIRRKAIEKLVKPPDVTLRDGAGNHLMVRGPKGLAVLVVDRKVGAGLAAAMRKGLIGAGVLSAEEFENAFGKEWPSVMPLDAAGQEYQASEKYGRIQDSLLRARLTPLLNAPPDTVVREAGVVLEDRLRQAATREATRNLHGVALVDALLSPDKAEILFSHNAAEQDGARMMFRGAMQYIRNPAMHRLMEHSEGEASAFVNIIDSLLLILTDATDGE